MYRMFVVSSRCCCYLPAACSALIDFAKISRSAACAHSTFTFTQQQTTRTSMSVSRSVIQPVTTQLQPQSGAAAERSRERGRIAHSLARLLLWFEPDGCTLSGVCVCVCVCGWVLRAHGWVRTISSCMVVIVAMRSFICSSLAWCCASTIAITPWCHHSERQTGRQRGGRCVRTRRAACSQHRGRDRTGSGCCTTLHCSVLTLSCPVCLPAWFSRLVSSRRGGLSGLTHLCSVR